MREVLFYFELINLRHGKISQLFKDTQQVSEEEGNPSILTEILSTQPLYHTALLQLKGQLMGAGLIAWGES